MTQVAAADVHLDIVRHRGKPLLLGFKDGNASGLQASLGHADAAVANPILQQQRIVRRLSCTLVQMQLLVCCDVCSTSADVACDPLGGIFECLLNCSCQCANERAGMYDAQLIQLPFLAISACQDSWQMACILECIGVPSQNDNDSITGM